MKVLEVIHCVWIDSESDNSWRPLEELDEAMTEIHSVGFLVHQDFERYVLAVSFDPDTQSANGIMHIPRAAVKKVKPVCAIKVEK